LSALSSSEQGGLQLTLGAMLSLPPALVTALGEQGIRVVGSALAERDGQVALPSMAIEGYGSAIPEAVPSSGSAAFVRGLNTGGSTHLQRIAYRDQLKAWVKERVNDMEELPARMTVARKIREGLESKNKFTLDISEISGLSSPPPMPLLGTKIKVKENQFSSEALDQLSLTGIEVIMASSADMQALVD
jgi:hypothetical protein